MSDTPRTNAIISDAATDETPDRVVTVTIHLVEVLQLIEGLQLLSQLLDRTVEIRNLGRFLREAAKSVNPQFAEENCAFSITAPIEPLPSPTKLSREAYAINRSTLQQVLALLQAEIAKQEP